MAPKPDPDPALGWTAVDVTIETLWVCTRCGACVDTDFKDLHDAWHNRHSL